MSTDKHKEDSPALAVATGSAGRSAEAILTDYVEDPQENGTYRLDIRGPQLDELWRACERDNRQIYALIAEVNRLRAWCDQVGDENDFCAWDAHPGTLCPKCNCHRKPASPNPEVSHMAATPNHEK